MRRRLDIAIAGAGPAGLATALYLDRQGHRVTIYERFEAARPIGSGLMLQPTGQAVLADLGLLSALQGLGQPIHRLDGRDARTGRTVLDVRYNALPGGQHGYGIHRAALFHVLHDAAVAVGIPIETGRAVSGVDSGDKATLLLDAGLRAGPFDLVVDASGAGTPLRSLARGGANPLPLKFGALWATVPWPNSGFDPHALTQRYRRVDIMIGVMPVGRRQASGPNLAAFFWSLPVEHFAAVQARGYDAWAAQVAELWPATEPVLANIGGFEALTLARYTHATMALPIGERIVFVGDSAHSTSPQLGQGANMALLDARALALALDTHDELDTALLFYARLRRWHVRLYQALSLSLTPFYQSESRVLPLLRDLLVAYVARVPPAPQVLAAMVSGSLLLSLKALALGSEPRTTGSPADHSSGLR